MSHSAADRNLLFGILALQMDFIGRDALIAAMHAWVLDKAKPLGQVLQDQGALRPDARALLEPLVEKHLELHGHDAERSLAAFAAPNGLRADLRNIADADLHASLAHLPPTPTSFHESLATIDPPAADGSRFHILRPHARGGLGEVFVAKDAELNREVALKEIQLRHADHPESRARFVREAEITGGLEHPGIVPVYALGHYPDGRPYYAMRFIRGTSLKEAIEQFHASGEPPGSSRRYGGDKPRRSPRFESLEFRQLLTRFIAVCNAIAYAHSRGVIHRDLKPSNIMLGEFGETLVVDWGLAKLSSPLTHPVRGDGGEASMIPPPLPCPTCDSELTHTGQALGTPAFMSPEQAGGRHDELGPASDVYSLGATLYCLLTGRHPFADADHGVVMQKVQRGEFPRPRQVMPGVPEALEAVCLKATALEAGNRYSSPRALADDIESWLADEPVTAWSEPWRLRARRWLGRHRTLVTSTVATVTVAVVVLAVALVRLAAANERERTLRTEAEDKEQEAKDQRAEALLRKEEAEKHRKEARSHLYVVNARLAQRSWEDGQIPRVEELLDEARRGLPGDEDLRGFEWYYLAGLCRGALRPLRGHTKSVLGVAFSPDGERLATSSGDGTVRVWQMKTGKELLRLEGHKEGVRGVAFSPDGEQLVSGGEDRTVKLWDARTGKEIRSYQGFDRQVVSVAFSPDGKQLAATGVEWGVAGHAPLVQVWETASGKELISRQACEGLVYNVAFSPDGQRLGVAATKGVRVWNADTGKEAYTLSGFDHSGLAFSPDGEHLVTASLVGQVRRWDAKTGKAVSTFQAQRGTNWIALSPDGQRLATCGYRVPVSLWEAKSGKEIASLKDPGGDISALTFSPDGQRLALAGDDPVAKIWELTTGSEVALFKGHADKVLTAAVSPNGRRVALGGSDNTLEVRELAPDKQAFLLRGLRGTITSAAFSPDGERLLVAGMGLALVVRDSATGQSLFSPKGGAASGMFQSVAFSPDGKRLAAGGFRLNGKGSMTKVWDAATGEEISSSDPRLGSIAAVMAIAFGEGARWFVTLQPGGVLTIWDSTSGKRVLNPQSKIDFGLTNLVVSPDGQQIIATGNGYISLFDVGTGKEVLSLKGHAGVRKVGFSPDGKRLASAGTDGTVKLWEMRTGKEVLSLKAGQAEVVSVAFSADGKQLLAASEDGTVRKWVAGASP